MIQMNKKTIAYYRKKAEKIFSDAGIVLRDDEKKAVEIADFGLGDFEKEGLSLITYVNTENVCAKEMILLPNQTCPEHYHPEKEETFRCRKGSVYLYVAGEPTGNIKADVPGEYYTVFKEIVLHPGDQYTLTPKTWHWFQGGEKGAIVSEFSTTSTDDEDLFRDPGIVREPETGDA